MPESSFFSKNYSINGNGRLISLSPPLVMGILNLSTDSFFDGGQYLTETTALKQVEKMITEGADIIDIGAVSSKPGAPISNSDEELKKLTPIIETIRKHFGNILISVDTYHSKVAEECIACGANIINDISAGDIDPNMFATIAKLKVPYIIMHMQGTPANMQQKPSYKDITKEIAYYFSEKIEQLKILGVSDIILDPGFGFGKTGKHNYELLQNMEYFKIFERPVLVGLSRKSMIYKLLQSNSEAALNGTTVLHTIALMKGASILRVHDVKEAKEVVKLITAINTPETYLT